MPWWGSSWSFRRPPTCQRKISWSYDRGGCRFAPGHGGPCKPVSRGTRAWRPGVPMSRTVARSAG